MMDRRRIAWWSLCAVLGTTIAAATAPDAHADSSSFLDAVHDLGWYNRAYGDVGLLNQGYAVCRALDDGYDGVQVATMIYRSTDLSVDKDDAATFVVVAVENLCPQFDQRGGSTA
jgi:hypothetical protein